MIARRYRCCPTNLKKLRYAKKQYFDEAANLWAKNLQIGVLALVHETMIEQSHGTKLEANWQGSYSATQIGQSMNKC